MWSLNYSSLLGLASNFAGPYSSYFGLRRPLVCETSAALASITLPGAVILSLTSEVTDISSSSPALNASSTESGDTKLVCQITIQYTHPGWNDTINTWVWAPLHDWNGRFMGVGGGGWVAGSLSNLASPVALGYSAASTDGGHGAQATVSSWGLTDGGNINWPLLQDFASVAIDEVATLGKAVTEAFYGSPIKYSYWNGCSTGGRQGHMLAQRYPTQFDGILAGAPAFNWAKFVLAEYWPQLVMTLLDYYPPACELQALTAAAIAACDEMDGLADGIISMPGLCHFDPMTAVGQTVDCVDPSGTITISEKGARVASAAWVGPTSESGAFVWYGLNFDADITQLAGTECVSLKSCRPRPFPVSVDWLRVFLVRNPSFDFSSLTKTEYNRLVRLSVNQFRSIIATDDPDLTDFKATGAKMIAWHGMKDELIPVNGTYDYYQRVLDLDADAPDYYRFFPAPGAGHCHPSSGWYPVDALNSLVNWVENGEVPDTLYALSSPTESASGPVRTAYLCAYPKIFTYTGGDPTQPSSYTCK